MAKLIDGYMYKISSLHPKIFQKLNAFYIQVNVLELIDNNPFCWACVWVECSAHIPRFNKKEIIKMNLENTTDIIFNEFGANIFHSQTPTITEAQKNSL